MAVKRKYGGSKYSYAKRFKRRPMKFRYRKRYQKRKRIGRFKVGGFPQKKAVKIRYATQLTLNAVASDVAYHVYSANGCYDPDITGTGHQPLGFDQHMEQYDHYTVVGSKITVEPLPASGTISYIRVFCDDAVDFPVGFSSVDHFLEAPGGTTVTVHGQTNEAVTPWTMKKHVKGFGSKKFFGNKSVVGDSLYRGSKTSNPTEQAYFHVCTGSVGGSDPGAVSFRVNIDYLVVFTEPKLMVAS